MKQKAPGSDPDKNKAKKTRELKEAMSASIAVSKFNRKRMMIGMILIVLLFVALVFRMAYWQVVRADDLREKALLMQRVDLEIDPVRGNIYDTNMAPLAQTVTEYELYAYTQSLYKDSAVGTARRKAILNELVELTGEKEEDLKEKLEGEDNLVKLAEGLDQDQVAKADELWGDNVVVQTRVARSYPNGDFASHLLGFVDSNNSGRNGLEYEYNSVLTGVKGRAVRTTDSQGNTLANGSSKYYQAEDGCSLVTTIDEVIQHYAEEAVEAGMKKTGADSITCVVMDPKTGNILALVNTPSYDPNDPYEPSDEKQLKAFNKLSYQEQSDYLSRMWTNRAISEVYEPSSTFKLVTSSSALDSGCADDNSTYECPGYINVDGVNLNCLEHHGTQNLTQAVGNSCNPALARVALDMGAETFYHYLDLYGFLDQTGIDLPGEGYSIVKDPDTLYNVDLATTGFGQGIAITPLQLLTAVNAMGNDGILMKPKVVRQILSSDGEVVEEIPDTAVRQVISKDVADEMRDIMLYYVEKGGGQTAYIPGYRVGGKTGTANIASGGGYSSQTVASFVAMAPMDDPVVSILVMVTRPKKSQYGAVNAGPIVKEILEKVLTYKGVERKYSSDEEPVKESNLVKVPDVTGMNSTQAERIIKAYGLEPQAVPEDAGDGFYVVDQYPKAGSKTERHGTVYIYSDTPASSDS